MASSGEGGRALAVLGQGEREAVAVSGQGGRAAAAVSGQGGRAAAAVSGQGGRAAAAVLCQGGCAALTVSGNDGRAAVAVSGDGEAAVSGKRKECDSILDYPCTQRLRWRRLLAYLRENCYGHIYDGVKDRLGVILDVEDLAERVRSGKLEEAYDYVRTFAPIRQFSSQAELLTLFLLYLTAIHRFADGNTAKEGIVRDWFRKLYRHPVVLSKYPCLATLAADVLSLRTHYVRSSLDWLEVRFKAAEIVEEMVSKTPDLREMTRYPRGQNELYDVMPIRCSFRPRRQVKKIGKRQATDLAKFYLKKKKRLLPSAQMDDRDYSGSARKSGVMLIELFEKVLQAGRRTVLKQDHSRECLVSGVFAPRITHVYKPILSRTMIEIRHRPEHASNQEKVSQAVQPMTLNQGHRPEYLSRGVSPLEAVHAYKSIADQRKPTMIEQGHRPEHASNQAMKRPRFLESDRDTVHQGNALKRQHS